MPEREPLTALLEGVAGRAFRAHADGVAVVELAEGALAARVGVAGVDGHLAVPEGVALVPRWASARGTMLRDLAHGVAAAATRVLALVVDAGLGGRAGAVVAAPDSCGNEGGS